MDGAEVQEIWGLFSALPSSYRSTAWPICLPAHRESPAAGSPPALLLAWRLLSETCPRRAPMGTSTASAFPLQLHCMQSRRCLGASCNQDSHRCLNPAFFCERVPLLIIPIFCQFWHMCEHVFVYKQYHFICCSLINVVLLRTSPTIVGSQLLP